MKIPLEPVRGMRDYIPPDSESLTWLIDMFKEVAMSYGYREVKTPTIELFLLFALKSGEEIRRSMYVFRDKAGREVALRPEVTPSVIRIYLRKLQAEPKPIKLYYIANVFRYDEPQFGRYREFWQAGIEILGGDGLIYDAELFYLLKDYYNTIGLRNYSFKIGSMALLRALFRAWDIEENEQDYLLHLLDKKMINDVMQILQTRYSKAEPELLSELLKIRTRDPNELIKSVGSLLDKYSEAMKAIDNIVELMDFLKMYNIDNFYIDLGFARGLAYYNGMIFEVEVPELRISIGGGGRYDNLTKIYGGPPLSSTGFALGIERTYLALQKQSYSIPITRLKALAIPLKKEALRPILELSNILRRYGITVELCDGMNLSVKRWFSYANRRGFEIVLVIGGAELARNSVTIKNMKIGEQRTVKLGEVLEVLKSWQFLKIK